MVASKIHKFVYVGKFFLKVHHLPPGDEEPRLETPRSYSGEH